MSYQFSNLEQQEQFRQDNPDADMGIYKGKREHLPWLKKPNPARNIFGCLPPLESVEKKLNEKRLNEIGE